MVEVLPLFADGVDKEVVKRNPNSFLTAYPVGPGRFEYRISQPAVARRYVRFLRSLGLVEEGELRLTPQGDAEMRARATRYNHLLGDAVEAHLRNHGLSRKRVERTLRNILEFRGIPSKAEVCDRLAREGHRLPAADIGLVLDTLGYAGALRMAIDRAYFPWG